MVWWRSNRISMWRCTRFEWVRSRRSVVCARLEYCVASLAVTYDWRASKSSFRIDDVSDDEFVILWIVCY